MGALMWHKFPSGLCGRENFISVDLYTCVFAAINAARNFIGETHMPRLCDNVSVDIEFYGVQSSHGAHAPKNSESSWARSCGTHTHTDTDTDRDTDTHTHTDTDTDTHTHTRALTQKDILTH